MLLNAKWVDEDKVEISRGSEVLVNVPVRFDRRGKWLKPKGNVKTKGTIGIISAIRGGCFRAATGFGRCDKACYLRPDGGGGCYANQTQHALYRQSPDHFQNPYNVIHNGLLPGTEEWFKITVPNNGYKLDLYSRKVWRVDSETTSSCLSVSLGLTQAWCEANPNKIFTGISSDYFYVEDRELIRAAACRNLVIGHTLSSWFAPDDLLNRIEQALRWQRFGVSTTVWVAQNKVWDQLYPESKKIVDAAIGMFDPKQIIAVAYHDQRSHLFTETVNPWGSCCEIRVDRKRQELVDNATGLLADGTPAGQQAGKCAIAGQGGCKLLCGYRWLLEKRRSTSNLSASAA